jgi:hypothetical protein
MKSFLYTLSPRSSSGYVNAYIYRVKHNKPELLGETRWNTASYSGERGEIIRFLMRKKHIPEGNVYKRPETYTLESV